MQTKSNIQLIREELEKRDQFKLKLQLFMDKWTVEDNYFSVSEGEITKGYFVIEHEYNDFDSAISHMSNNQTIRIIENKRFQIGQVFEKLSDAKGEKIVDITTGMMTV